MKKMNVLVAALLAFSVSSAHADVENAVKLEKRYAGFAKAANPE